MLDDSSLCRNTLADLTIQQRGSNIIITVDGFDDCILLGGVRNLIGREDDVFLF
jgi:hypothetical protein